ncbi:MAG: hypothetical protein BA871_02250 [Desulfuromonadales bacterium C00003096]|jgi:CRISPR/Cas system-associated protein Csx1|nr:MAG: hypothetical protein BA871_02250 [Desulfuromonadales bacterium C00003096]
MEILLPIIAFISSLFSFVALIIILNKLTKLKHPLTSGVLIAILHFMIVALLDIVIKISVKEYPDTNFLWMLVTFIDLPVVLILKLFNYPEVLSNPYIMFGIFGSLQYFSLGFVISYLVNKRDKNNLTKL